MTRQRTRFDSNGNECGHLIGSLEGVTHTDAFIGDILQEENPDEYLLRDALREVVGNRIKDGTLSELGLFYHEALYNMLTDTDGEEIYTLKGLLNELGYRLDVVPVSATEPPSSPK